MITRSNLAILVNLALETESSEFRKELNNMYDSIQ